MCETVTYVQSGHASFSRYFSEWSEEKLGLGLGLALGIGLGEALGLGLGRGLGL